MKSGTSRVTQHGKGNVHWALSNDAVASTNSTPALVQQGDFSNGGLQTQSSSDDLTHIDPRLLPSSTSSINSKRLSTTTPIPLSVQADGSELLSNEPVDEVTEEDQAEEVKDQRIYRKYLGSLVDLEDDEEEVEDLEEIELEEGDSEIVRAVTLDIDRLRLEKLADDLQDIADSPPGNQTPPTRWSSIGFEWVSALGKAQISALQYDNFKELVSRDNQYLLERITQAGAVPVLVRICQIFWN